MSPSEESIGARQLLFVGAAAVVVTIIAGGTAALSGSSFAALPAGESQAAATWLGDQQGVPPNFTGQSFPDRLDCYANLSGHDYGPVYTPICDSHGNLPIGDAMNFYSGVLSVHPPGSATGFTRYATISAQQGGQDSVSGPSAYTYSVSTDGAGQTPTVQAGSPITLEWSCLPYRYSRYEYKTGQSWYSNGYWVTGTYFALNPLATHAALSGPGISGNYDTTGSVSVVPPSAGSYSYTLTCAGGAVGSTMTVPVDVSVPPVPSVPTASISASLSSIYVGQSSTITATYAASSGDTLTGTAIEQPLGTAVTATTAQSPRTYTFTPTSAGTYTFYARAKSQTYPSWATYGTPATVTVSSVAGGCNGTNCSGPTPNPAGPVLPGTSVTLSWSCSSAIYTSSQGDSNYSTGGALSGTRTVTPTQTTTYSLTCISPGGNSSGSATVTVVQPSLSITASPSKVRAGNPTTLTWSATNVTANSCTVSSSPSGVFSSSAASGTGSPTVNSATTFTLRCSVPSGSVSQSVTVNLLPHIDQI